jgi:subtilase family serine protease
LHAPRFAPDRVLVKFKPGTAALAKGHAHRRAGARELKKISRIGVDVVEVPAGKVWAKVAAYRANPNVLYAEPDYYRVMVMPTEEPGPTPAGHANYFQEQWYLHNSGQSHTRVEQTIFGPELSTTRGTVDADIDAPEGWDLSRGVSTTDPTAADTPKVAVLDSGADCGALELQGKCLEQTNLVGLDPGFFGLDSCPPDAPACDNFGHGTFVASLVAANTNNGEGIAGAGWNTSVGVFKVCYQEVVTDGVNAFLVGLCPLSASAEAITLAATDQRDGGNQVTRSQYHVITMSYGSDLIDPDTGEIRPSAPPETECDAVLYAWNRGVVVVAGAGNNGDTNKFYPAACTDDPNSGTGQSTVIAVAASDHDDNRAGFSTYSTDADDWVSVAAPGEAIVGVLPDAHCDLASGVDTCVNWLDGTSMATPLVAAGAALVWSDLYQSGAVDGARAPSTCTAGGTPCNQVVRERIENGADTVGAQGQDLLQWTRHGRLNLANALSGGETTRVTVVASVPLASEAGPGTGRFTVRRTGSTDEALLVRYTITGTAAPGADYVPLPATVTIPAGAESADLDVVALDDTLVEENETVTLTIVSDPAYLPGAPSSGTVLVTSDDPPPDLVVTSLTVPANASAGATIDVADVTSNQGGGPAGPSVTRFYLSANSALDPGDPELGARAIPALAPGTPSAGSIALTIPPGTAAGTYQVLARADADGALVEEQEANNILARPIQIVRPDLVVSPLSAPATTGAGLPITVSDTTRNQGAGAAGSSSTTFHLSTDSKLDAGDALLGSRAVPALAPNQSSSGATILTIPAGTAPGTHWLIARADATGAVAETSETNNTTVRSLQVGPDLTVTSLTAPPAAEAGATIALGDTTANGGAGSAAASVTAFYLSTNTTLDAGDIVLGSRSVPALGPGQSSAGTVTVTLPANLGAGTYYVIARADNAAAVAETQEGNNTRATAVQVGADLVISAFTVPATAGAGQSITVSDSTKNQGGGSAGASTTTFYLSTNTVLDAGDVPLGSRSVPGLVAGGTSSASTILTIPAGTAAGSYRLIARADAGDEVTETQDANNTSSRAIQIGADLLVSLSVPATAMAGTEIAVTDTTRNPGGGGAGATTTAFYLSGDTSLSADDAALGSRPVPPLGAGAASRATTNVALPAGIGTGSYYILARADANDEVDESQEGNNTTARLIQVGPDLTVTNLTGPTTAAPGATITVGDTTRNQGGDTAVASTTAFYLSSNSTFDAADAPLGSRPVPALAPGAMHAVSTNLVIPAGTTSGSYFLIAVADGNDVIAEAIETNNTRSRSIQVGP